MRLTYQVSVIVALCLFALVLGLGVISFFGPFDTQAASAGQVPATAPTGAAVSDVNGANGVTLKVYAASPVPTAVSLPTVAPTDVPTSAPSAVPTDAPQAVAAAPIQATVIVTMIVEATAVPTNPPTAAPTQAATTVPTNAPTSAPTQAATSAPTAAATQAAQAGAGSSNATVAPTTAPTKAAAKAPTAVAAAPKRMPVTAESDETISSTVWAALMAMVVLVVVVGGLSFRAYGNVLGFADTVAAQFRAIREAAKRPE